MRLALFIPLPPPAMSRPRRAWTEGLYRMITWRSYANSVIEGSTTRELSSGGVSSSRMDLSVTGLLFEQSGGNAQRRECLHLGHGNRGYWDPQSS